MFCIFQHQGLNGVSKPSPYSQDFYFKFNMSKYTGSKNTVISVENTFLVFGFRICFVLFCFFVDCNLPLNFQNKIPNDITSPILKVLMQYSCRMALVSVIVLYNILLDNYH